MTERFTGKVAVVTGGASGMGLAIARRFLKEGGRVAVLDLNLEGLEAAKDEFAVAGDRVMLSRVNVADEQQVVAAISKIEVAFGRVDALFNAAGIISRENFDGTDLAIWERIVSVDLTGTFLMVRHAVSVMRRSGGGSIVNIASVASIRGGGNPAYSAAKGGVAAVTRDMAFALAGDNIRVNAVSPGFTATGMNVDTRTAGVDKLWIGRIPLKRFARPDEIASVCLFLASDDASYLTGTNVVADGGLCSVLLPDVAPFAEAHP